MRTAENVSAELKSLAGLRSFEPRRSAVQLSLNLSGRLPSEEQLNLAQQMFSVDGYGRRSPRGYAHYIMVAHGSLLELDTQLEIALGAGYLDNEDLADVQVLISRVAGLLSDVVRALGPDLAALE
jgi:four helix bundle protein